MTTWNERFAEALAASGLSLAEFSRQAELSHVAALRWMGTPSMSPAADAYASALLRACRVLDVRIEWILDGELPRNISQAWPFTTSRERIEQIPLTHRILIDRLIIDIIQLLDGVNQENSS